jgi:hypothetical protein
MAAKALVRRVAEDAAGIYAAVASYLFGTLDCLNPYENDGAAALDEFDNDCENSSDGDFPSLHL